MELTPHTPTATSRSADLSRHAVKLLEDILLPLRRHYERPDITEAVVCAPGTVFHKLREPNRFGYIWRAAPDPSLTHEYLRLAIESVANVYDMPFHIRDHPQFDGELPGNHRLTAVLGASVLYDERLPEGGVSICIRQGRNRHTPLINLDAWDIPWDLQDGEGCLRTITAPTDTVHEKILEAARTGRALLLSGPTDTGKTTLLNRLIDEIHDDTRVITVEDSKELMVNVPNRVHLFTARQSGDAQLAGRLDNEAIRNIVVRSTPNAVIIGEISPTLAPLAIELFKTGHDHCWTSIHAESPDEALGELARMGSRDPVTRQLIRDESATLQMLRERFTIVQLGTVRKRRVILETRFPDSARNTTPYTECELVHPVQ